VTHDRPRTGRRTLVGRGFPREYATGVGPDDGQCMARIVTEGESSLIDVSVFDLKRFARGAILQDAYGGNRA